MFLAKIGADDRATLLRTSVCTAAEAIKKT